MCLFIAFLSSKLKRSSVYDYVASLAQLHHQYNFESPNLGHYATIEALAVCNAQALNNLQQELTVTVKLETNFQAFIFSPGEH